MPVVAAQPFNAFLQGRQARQDEQYADTRNALAQQDIETSTLRNRLTEQQYSQEQISRSLQQTAAAASRLAQSQNPKAEARMYPEFVGKLREQGIDIEAISDDEARDYFEWIAGQAQSKLGIAPAAPAPMSQYQKAQIDLERQKLAQPKTMSPYEQARIDIEQRKLNQPKTDAGPLVQVAGPDGNPIYRTRGEAVGQPAYVARDKPAAADLKYQRELKTKIPRLNAAERRIERLELGLKSVAGNTVFDGGPLDAKALRYTKQGQEVVQAAASLLPELTALTRVPGIGSQSDLETRLANLQLPSLEFAPEVNTKALAELRAFIADLKDAYTSASQGDSAVTEQQAAVPTFATEAEAEAAGLKPGARVVIGGVSGTWQ